MMRLRAALWGVLALSLGTQAAAEEPPSEPPPSNAELAKRLRLLEEQNQKLNAELADLKRDLKSVEERHDALSAKVSGKIGGYIDIGFFHVQGNGTGFRTDVGHLRFPEFSDVPDSWVFMGDPLATAINSRGEPSTTGESRAVTFNPVKNDGVSSFIANALNLQLFAGLGPNLTLNGMVDFVPRSRNVSDPNGLFVGDFIDVKLAYAEYTIPTDKVDIRITAGKMDSVLGIEYRTQEASQRLTVTPSLICRYTCGRPLGVKIRGRFFNDLLVLAISLSNGSHFTEGFPFGNEIDANNFKTVAARLSTKIPLGQGLEIGASGAYGAQDFQRNESVYQWHYGVDLRFTIRGFDLRGEFVQGGADGELQPGMPIVPCGISPCLAYKGAYGQVSYRILNWLIPYGRVDWREAFHRSGQSFVYISELMRVTGGLRLELGEYVILKGEYTHIRELGRLPQFPDDVVTSSLVVKY